MNQNVESAEAIADLLEQARHGLWVGQVAADVDRSRRTRSSGKVRAHDLGARRLKELGNGGSDPAAGTGHQRQPAFEREEAVERRGARHATPPDVRLMPFRASLRARKAPQRAAPSAPA